MGLVEISDMLVTYMTVTDFLSRYYGIIIKTHHICLIALIQKVNANDNAHIPYPHIPILDITELQCSAYSNSIY